MLPLLQETNMMKEKKIVYLTYYQICFHGVEAKQVSGVGI
jgi:hypothetical protein